MAEIRFRPFFVALACFVDMLVKIVIVIFVCVALVAITYALHRFAIVLEKHGYIYYREKSKSGAAAGVFRELDELVRPNTRHVVEAEQDFYAKESEEQGAGDVTGIEADPNNSKS